MKITKIGHCCLLIETKGKRILTDPGNFSIEGQSKLMNIDYILYTHEHPDHYHLDSLKTLLLNNPKVIIYSNDSVGALLDQEQIPHITMKHRDKGEIAEIALVAVGEKHAVMHKSIPPVSNIGFYIDSKLWYPGDAFTDPREVIGNSIDVLALPVSGPWMKISEALDYALELKPKKVFPVHDAIRFGSAHVMPKKILEPNGIEFVALVEGESLKV